MLANRRISTLRQLADHRRRAGRLSARQEADEDALAECASLARAVLRRAAGEGAADGDAAASKPPGRSAATSGPARSSKCAPSDSAT